MKASDSIDIIGIIKQTLNSVDARLIDHGNSVAYLLFKVLQPQRMFGDTELRDICILAMLHDIGAYKTEEIDQMAVFETVDVRDHSIYGYLFLKYFSPLSELAPVILYHHADCDEVKELEDEKQRTLAQLMSLCDRAEIFIRHKGNTDEFKRHINRNRGIKFRDDVVDMFLTSGIDIGNIAGSINSDEEYISIFKNNPLSEEEVEKYINTLVYSIDFRSRQTVIHTIYTVSIAATLAQLHGVPENEIGKIKLGAVLHDIGKVGVPVDILESTDRLNGADMEVMKTHADVTGKILEGNTPEEIKRIAVNHHEKLNGTGYPQGLDSNNIHLYDRIVAVADITSALCRERNYKKAYPREKAIAILEDMSGQNLIDPEIVALLVRNFDDVIDIMEEEAMPVVHAYLALSDEYRMLRGEV